MSIKGYVYEAAEHCVDCAVVAFGESYASFGNRYVETGDNDANGIPYEATDSEGNQVSAILEHSETAPCGVYCSSCGNEIAEPWLQDGYEVLTNSSKWESALDAYYWREKGESEIYGPFDSHKAAVIACGMEVGF